MAFVSPILTLLFFQHSILFLFVHFIGYVFISVLETKICIHVYDIVLLTLILKILISVLKYQLTKIIIIVHILKRYRKLLSYKTHAVGHKTYHT